MTEQNLDLDEQARQLYQGHMLAPMVRASTTPLRALALHYGAHAVYSEELVDRSITSTIRQENSTLGTIDYVKDPATIPKKTLKKLQKENRPSLLLRIDPKLEANKLVLQIGTGEPELALPAAKHVYQDVSSIDVNMGCPKKFSVSGGMGSALLADKDRASRIIKTLRAEIPRPVSCKIRLLKDTAATIDFMQAMIQAGAQAIAVHARRVGDEATKPADWATLQEVFELMKPKYPHIPFLVNGDFYDRQETKDLLDKTNANGVLIGRPALYNTSIFRPLPQEMDAKTKVVQEYVQRAARYDIHHKNAKYVVCEMMSHRRTPSHRVPYLPQQFPGGQNTAKTCNCHSMEAMCQLWNVSYSASQYRSGTTIPGASISSTSAGLSGDALMPGEHRYEDDYFLKHEKRHQSSLAQESSTTSSPDAKKARLEVAEEKKC